MRPPYFNIKSRCGYFACYYTMATVALAITGETSHVLGLACTIGVGGI